MANIRQYIGARYVLKIYENSQDPSSAEWEQGNYEPLVMVTWQNGSYLSKKDVPGTVGNPANNPNYWVQTGFYNGQIAALQQQIDDINNTLIPNIEANIQDLTNKIASVNDRKYIFIGDSYQAGAGNNGTSWLDYMAGYMGIVENVDYFHAENGGYGFTPSNATFLSLLEGLDNSITDKNSITDLIVTGGLNEWETYTALPNSIGAFCSYAKTTYPNAKIHIGYLGNLKYHAERKFSLRQVLDYYMNCSYYGDCHYISGCENLCHNYNYYKDDEWHPNAFGYREIARGILNYLNNAGIDVQGPYSSPTFTLDSYFNSGNMTINESRMNDIVIMKSQRLSTFKTASSNTVYDDREFTLGIVNPVYLCGIYQNLTRVAVPIYIGVNGNMKTMPAYLQLTADTNELKLLLAGDHSALTFDTIIIPPFEMVAPTFLT